MCEYCGCQQITAIAELTAEHEQLRDLGARLTTAADRGDRDCAALIASDMLEVLMPHTAVEEHGLFPALAGEFGPALDGLVGDHRRIDEALTALGDRDLAADGWVGDARAVVAELFEHILKEQDGVFPAALATLGPSDWDSVDAARAATVPLPLHRGRS